ncbi:hypothetical protein MCAL160_0084 [Mycoplasmopsis californica HAZ160_1]|uniref:Uncharacterized protein n=1 Tax=Mycoplasmopsis californica HAZ160_1 TaxID=1397850 RepID=A0AAT9F7E6_9BACT|nr:hypothetical protein [Mycoplasmopsis californica]BAP00825.1 hypothetical protein MCAL160_0084 [Mycoplasmopsis californica HAZ160_1]BBG40681.1 hypothetical protein MCAL106_0084 [Mycoplasmopsis californica]BBG41276.1 hypothetical protein MCAL106E_0084 [Mycoplasmopsis californica]BBG41869.1 hypothetical protein MCAL106L_0084 [Mycoplasmopsis californica]BBG42461.1 hypothetical protein MCAL160E_0084 [Mycoplasmopsis californica]
MKSKKNGDLLSNFNHTNYGPESLFASLLKEDKDFKKDVLSFMRLLPLNKTISAFDDTIFPDFKYDKTKQITPLNIEELQKIKANLYQFDCATKVMPKDIFKDISLQKSDLAHFLKNHIGDAQNIGEHNWGFESRFSNEDTVTLADSAEIVIKEVRI